MIVDRYYYQQLNAQEQMIYRAFYDGVKSFRDFIPLPIHGSMSEEQFRRIFFAVTRDNPLIYYLNQSAGSYASDRFGHVAICPRYFFEQAKVKEYNRKIECTVNELAEKLKLTECGDYEKERRVHDWICQNVEYDYEGADVAKPVRVISSHSILGVFAHHRAQCEGIAKAVKILLNAVDVKCIVVTGETFEQGMTIPHAWNLVSIEGRPYQLDVTWDIGIGRKRNQISYDYFNLTDEEMNREHKADSALPRCRARDANYFVQNQVSFLTKYMLFSYLEKALGQGFAEIQFRLEERLRNQTVLQEISQFLVKKSQNMKNSGGKAYLRQEFDRKTGVYRIEMK